MGRASRDKGKRGERELAKELTKLFGVAARRGQQFHGGPDSPDVVCDIPGIHWECKRTERLKLWEAICQAQTDACSSGEVPVVCHRKNQQPWLITLQLEHLPAIVQILRHWIEE